MQAVIADLEDYRDRAKGVDPLRLWAECAQHNLPGVIFWTVSAENIVKLSVGAGFDGIDIEEREAEGTSLSDWTSLAVRVVDRVRVNGTVSMVALEDEGPAAGGTFLTCGVLHHSGDVVLMTVDLSSIEEGHDALLALKG